MNFRVHFVIQFVCYFLLVLICKNVSEQRGTSHNVCTAAVFLVTIRPYNAAVTLYRDVSVCRFKQL